jgi:hypothetical protein
MNINRTDCGQTLFLYALFCADCIDSFDFFSAFAAWDHVDIKQTAGDASLCSLSQVDTDFIEEK